MGAGENVFHVCSTTVYCCARTPYIKDAEWGMQHQGSGAIPRGIATNPLIAMCTRYGKKPTRVMRALHVPKTLHTAPPHAIRMKRVGIFPTRFVKNLYITLHSKLLNSLNANFSFTNYVVTLFTRRFPEK